MESVVYEILIFLIAVLGGTIGSLVGLGGALVITPMLSTVVGIPLHYAIGASLVAIICTSSATSLVSLKSHGLTKEKLGLFLALATAVGAIIGAEIAIIIAPKILFMIFGIMLLIVAILSFFKKDSGPNQNVKLSPLAYKLQLNDTITIKDKTISYNVEKPLWGFLAMSGAGFIGGLLGIGAGVFKVVAMDKIMKIPFRVSTSTSNFVMGITAFAATSTYYFAGYINGLVTLPVALGTLLGATIGSKIMPHIPVTVLRLAFFLVVLIAAVQMIGKGFF